MKLMTKKMNLKKISSSQNYEYLKDSEVEKKTNLISSSKIQKYRIYFVDKYDERRIHQNSINLKFDFISFSFFVVGNFLI